MSERLTPSELVYLFVDGEATGSERTEMYAALATDNDLQSEFEDALRLKQTTDEEIAVTAPPLETTRALFLKAGFSAPVPIVGGEAIAPAVSQIADSGIFTALKSLVAPFFVSTGIIATGIVSMPFFDRIETKPVGTEQTVTTPIAQVFPTVGTNATNGTNVVNVSEPTTTTATPAQARTAQRHETSVVSRNDVRSSRMHAVPEVVEQLPIEPVAVVNNAPVETAVNELPLVASVSQEQLRADYPSSVLLHESPVRIQQIADVRTFKQDSRPRDLWFEVRRITDLKLYPSRNADGAKDLAINNVALSAEYQISPTSRIGLAAGTETFPHYTVNADTSLTEKWNIVWAGVSYAFTAPSLALGPLTPSASFLIGGGATGPIGKTAIGLSWQPDDRVSFTGGIEMTGLLYHYGTDWRVGGKLGATYSVAVRF